MADFVAAGNVYSIARRRDGTVWTWGGNFFGQLGFGDPALPSSNVPRQVPGIAGARAVTASWINSYALMNDGFIQACGNNEPRLLGRPATSAQISFLPVQRFRRPRAVSTGALHCLATYKGHVYAWGENRYGGFGIGSQGQTWIYPRQLPGVNGVIQAVCGLYGQSFLLRRSGPRLLAAGRNDFGQLGDGTTTDRPGFVAIPGMSDVVAIRSDGGATLALRDDGTVWAWGRNGAGQLGDGTTIDRLTPSRVGRLRRIKAIAMGAGFGLALDDLGRVTGWGANMPPGPSGNGALAMWLEPGKIELPRPIVAIAAGDAHALAVDDSGHVWGWGQNDVGQVGIGSNAFYVSTPTRLPGISQVG
jgi:alpha-tubulin suppressor-like RCC1 family protein